MNDQVKTAMPNDLLKQREELYKQLESLHIEPLWRVLGDAAQTEPKVLSIPISGVGRMFSRI